MSQTQKFKIVFVGNQSVGKTSIIQRFIYDQFQPEETQPTVGIDFISKTMSVDSQTIRLQVWDTAGQERFKSLIPSYIRDANAIVLVYDQSKVETYNALDQWIAFIKEHRGDKLVVLLLANKSDHTDKEVDEQTGINKANEQQFIFQSVSAKSGHNIQQAFKELTLRLVQEHTQELSVSQDKINLENHNQQVIQKSTCC